MTSGLLDLVKRGIHMISTATGTLHPICPFLGRAVAVRLEQSSGKIDG
jgi:hypothetical protein